MADCEQPTRAPTKLRFRQFQRFILSRLTVGAQIRHGNPPFLRLTAEFERQRNPQPVVIDPHFARLDPFRYICGMSETQRIKGFCGAQPPQKPRWTNAGVGVALWRFHAERMVSMLKMLPQAARILALG
jgi:hypothetical protein